MGTHRTQRRRLLADRLARYSVVAGGVTIIASILGILVFIVVEVAPLMSGARVTTGSVVESGVDDVGAVLSDGYGSRVALLSGTGDLRVVDPRDGSVVLRRSLLDPRDAAPDDAVVAVRPSPGQRLFVATTRAGRLIAQPLEWHLSFTGQTRHVAAELPPAITFEMDPAGARLAAFSAAIDPDGVASAVALLQDGTIAVVRREVDENPFTGETTETWERHTVDPARPIDRLLIDTDQATLYAANREGQLFRWIIDDGVPGRMHVIPTAHGAITSLSLLIGDRSLVVGHADGTISIWFDLRSGDTDRVLTRVREFSLGDAPVTQIAPSLRDKGFLAVDRDGQVGLFYSTSGRTLWRGRSPIEPVSAIYFSPKANRGYLAAPGRVAELAIDNPHPEIGWNALFGKVWYEGYPRPDYVWQSSGGTDDFEAKLSVTPLLFGTLKGTVYSLILAIPLGVLGAMYTSQFMHQNLRRYVKPTVEIMAALPSVVLGFLAGLWLAPRIARMMPALFLMVILTPVMVIAAGVLWRRLPRAVRSALPDGIEAVLQLGVVAGSIALCLVLNDPLETGVFGGSFQDWLFHTSGVGYDQRNSVVVGLAMGFAVIPIIFSIAEDAFSNVPRNLVSGSLALGASRWQTVTRVVLPSASPGIFSAIMIGFGRAVGETMIVLMATGNTPLMDWNLFNGFRTLSANIAVEIPEAPQGDTLYRTLFLAALLLFVFTFLTNTVADAVRQRLRRRYAQL